MAVTLNGVDCSVGCRINIGRRWAAKHRILTVNDLLCSNKRTTELSSLSPSLCEVDREHEYHSRYL